MSIRKYLQCPTTSVAWYELVWPKHMQFDKVSAWLHVLSGAHASRGMGFVVVAHKGTIHHYLLLPKSHQEHLLHTLTMFLPDIELHGVPPMSLTPDMVASIETSDRHHALNTEHPEISNFAILSALQGVGTKEQIILVWKLHTRTSPHTFRVPTLQSFGISLAKAFVRPPEIPDAHESLGVRIKQSAPAWQAALYVGVSAANRQRRNQLYGQMVGSLRCVETVGSTITARNIRAAGFKPTHHRQVRWPLRITVNELSGLLGWPVGDLPVPGLVRITSRRLPIPRSVPDRGRVIGESVIPGSKKRLMQSVEDGLMHTHIIGPTGVGKSTLLLNLVTQDIADGRGAIVIDPKGDLVTDILARIPSNRVDDVVVLDPTDMDYPVGLNPLARYSQPATLIADDILSIFRKLYGAYFGPRSEDILHAGLLTLTSAANMSLCTLPVLYTNPVFRRRLLDELNDPLGLGSFWSWFETISTAQRNVALAPVMNKLRAFLLRPNIRRVIGQGAPRFDITDVFDDQKILLVNLAKGSLGSEASQLFGSLVVSQIWQAIQARGKTPQSSRSPVFMYVDEVQDYLHLPTDIADVLAQSRSYGVGMVLAHQHLGQLPKDLKSAVLANARSRICFQLAHEDALTILGKNTQLTPDDFEDLRRYYIYVRLAIDGRVSPWMSGKTKAPGQPTGNPAIIRERSRVLYGQAASDVETALQTTLIGTTKA